MRELPGYGATVMHVQHVGTCSRLNLATSPTQLIQEKRLKYGNQGTQVVLHKLSLLRFRILEYEPQTLKGKPLPASL
jgi:hypothetical protein